MENLLSYPESTVVGKVVPKNMFYRFLDVDSRMKEHFVNDVSQLVWLYKLSESTLSVTASDSMPEIDVFVAELKRQDCPADLFAFIDRHMPHHLVFILKDGQEMMLLINYKEWKDGTHTEFRIAGTFATVWMAAESLQLKIEGQSLQRIYDNFVAQISGIGEHKAGALSEIVELKKRIAAMEAELQSLEKKMRREPQYDIQVRMKKQVNAKRQELAELRRELEALNL